MEDLVWKENMIQLTLAMVLKVDLKENGKSAGDHQFGGKCGDLCERVLDKMEKGLKSGWFVSIIER